MTEEQGISQSADIISTGSSVEHPNSPKPCEFIYGDNPNITFFFPNDGGAKILAEKYKLASISEYFRTELPKSDFSSGDRRSITDISFDTFNIFIKYVYGNQIDIYEDNYQQILYVATMFFVYDLIHLVMEFLLSFINADNLIDHYEAIEKFNIKTLDDHIKTICITYPIKVLKDLAAKPLPSYKRILRMILEDPFLPCSEFDLYQAIVETMFSNIDQCEFDVEEKMRKELGNLIYLIRFPIMTVDELIECQKYPSLLIEREFIDFILWIKNKKFSYSLLFYSTMTRK